MHGDIQTGRHTDRQTDRQRVRQTDRHTVTLSNRYANTQPHRHTDSQTYRHTAMDSCYGKCKLVGTPSATIRARCGTKSWRGTSSKTHNN